MKVVGNFGMGFGGYPKEPLVIDSSGVDVVFSESNQFLKGRRITEEVTSSISQISVTPPQSPTEPYHSGEKDERKSGTSGDQPHQEPLKRPGNNPCIRGGLSYFENKCYLDTALTLLLVESPENKFRDYLLQSATQVRDAQEPRLSEFAQEFIRVSNKLADRDIFQARIFVDKLKKASRK